MYLTAKSLADSILSHTLLNPQVILCGGGRLNPALVKTLETFLNPHKVSVTEDFGIDGDFLEAGLCAWVAYQTMNGLASNVPAVTGSRGPRILGGVFTGKLPL